MSKPRIYLAHSFHLMVEAKEEVEPLLAAHFEVLNPFEKRYDRLKEYVGRSTYSLHKTSDPSQIVETDLNLISKSDGVFVYNIDGTTTGSTMEIAYGHGFYRLPVVAVVPRKKLYHPWLQYHCKIVTTSVNKAIQSLVKHFENQPNGGSKDAK